MNVTAVPIFPHTAPTRLNNDWLKTLCLMILCIATALTSHTLYAQQSDAFSPSEASSINLPQNNKQSLTSETSNSFQNTFTNPFAESTEEFLTVDEAYKLSIRASDTSIIAEWVIEEKYFLYGEQFRFFINGDKVDATRPAGEVSYDVIFEKDVEKYYTYTQAIINRSALPAAINDNNSIQLSVTYQGCADAGLCYPPETKNFSIQNNQVSEIRVTLAHDGNSPQQNTTSSNTQSTLSITLLMLLLAIGGGAILNLMPCVFPVLSIKALSLANHTDTRSRIRHGWSYTLGCVLTFVVIAGLLLLIRDAGKAVGWGFQLQSPSVITFLAFLFFIMGLCLSGRIQLGGSWMGMGQSLTQGNSTSSSFFTGVLAAVVASPCTAPFMATALGYALTQPTPIALLIFAALGFGMALPFLLLSHLPQLNRLLPKPGQWMETFKQAVAFPLYLTSIWLLWVLGQQVGSDGIVLSLLGVFAILFSLWISGIKPRLKSLTVMLSCIAIVAIIWQNNQRIGYEDDPQATSSHGLWEPYTSATLTQLRNNNATIFVNLTADWCITCKWNEKRVFTDETLQAMKDKGVYLLEGDWTRYNEEITALLDEYGRGGVPLYLLFKGDELTPATILPQILNPNDFKQLIEQL
ncbi:Cytochrome c-type biogenesis protein DsbD [gamma proteobacterium IMCC1989]|nr:Cytochrome c-type biogenesis protein DsbD [gamma proteobacterium IMCC1989]